MNIDGKTALVTGGADGIGGGIAERLAAEGMHVVIADMDDRTGPVMAERTGGSFVRTDISTEAGVAASPATRRDRSACWSTTPEAPRSRTSPRRTRRGGSVRST